MTARNCSPLLMQRSITNLGGSVCPVHYLSANERLVEKLEKQLGVPKPDADKKRPLVFPKADRGS